MTHGVADLVESNDNITRRVKTGNLCALVGIDHDAAFVGNLRTKRYCEFGMNDRAQRRIDRIET